MSRFFKNKYVEMAQTAFGYAAVGGLAVLADQQAQQKQRELENANPGCRVERRMRYLPGVGCYPYFEVFPQSNSPTSETRNCKM